MLALKWELSYNPQQLVPYINWSGYVRLFSSHRCLLALVHYDHGCVTT